jgi:hypothetical protein
MHGACQSGAKKRVCGRIARVTAPGKAMAR